jgi:hypothetical protein
VEEIVSDAEHRSPFSNGFEWDCWASKWCERCVHDLDSGCPLIMASLLELTPKEWGEERMGSLPDRYQCTEFLEDTSS